jgi:hypothetical protein
MASQVAFSFEDRSARAVTFERTNPCPEATMNKNAARSLQEPVFRRAPARAALNQPRSRVADPPRLRVVLDRPRVVPIYWDKHFRREPSDVVAFNEFLRILFESTFMSGLSAHGIQPARLLPAFVPDDEAPTRLTRARLEAQLTQWLASEQLAPSPKKLESSLLFLVLAPLGSQSSLGAPAANTRNFGYHDSIPFVRPDSQKAPRSASNLHYAAVPLVSTGSQILEVHSRAVSQQLGQAFIARTRRG